MNINDCDQIKECRNTIIEVLCKYIPTKEAKIITTTIDKLIRLHIDKYDKSQAQW